MGDKKVFLVFFMFIYFFGGLAFGEIKPVVQMGHGGPVNSITFSPDGRLLASGSSDKTIKLWEVSTGRLLKTLKGHVEDVNSVAFSPDGRLLAGGGDDSVIKLWEVSTGKLMYTFKGSWNGVLSIAFSPDGKYLASGSRDGILRIWRVSTGKLLYAVEEENEVTSVSFSPNGELLASGVNYTIKLRDVSTGRLLRTFTGHKHYTISISFSPDGKYLASGSQDDTIKLWDVSTGKLLYTLESGYTISISFSPDGKYLASAGVYTIRVWEVSTGKLVHKLEGHNAVRSISFSPDGRLLASGGSIIEFWDISKGKPIKKTFNYYTCDIRAVSFSPDGKFLASGSSDETIKLWEVPTGRLLKTLKGHEDGISSVSFSPDGKYLASGSWDNTIKLWEVPTGRLLKTLKGHEDRVTSVSFSPDGKYLASGSWDNTIKLWEVPTGRLLKTIEGNEGERFECIAFGPKGRLLAGEGKLWDVLTGRLVRTFEGGCSSFSPNGQFLASWGLDQIKLWKMSTGQQVRDFVGHEGGVLSVVFSPDGKLLASGGGDGTIRFWNMSNGKLLATLYVFPDASVIITPEGYFSGTGNYEKYVHFVDGLKIYTFSQFARRFYRPELVKLALQGKPLPSGETMETVVAKKPAPEVKILFPENGFTTADDRITLKVQIKDTGGGIGDIHVFVNGVLVNAVARGIKVVYGGAKSFTVALSEGENRIRVVAYNGDNTLRSHPAEIIVRCSYRFGAPRLFALVVGINEFENPDIALRFAIADARLFANTLKQVATPLFKEVTIKLLVNKEETTKDAIKKAFQEIEQKIKANDYFIFYVASHGETAILPNGDSEYYLLTSNVVFLDPQNLARSALSKDELVNLIGNVPAQNKIIVLDTCYAGEAGKALQVALAKGVTAYTRALSTKTAMELLKMASGASIFAASQKIEQALEGYHGHGLFTYVLSETLKGKADINGDGFVKLTELKSTVEQEVWQISKSHFKHPQVPYISVGSFDFPLGKLEK